MRDHDFLPRIAGGDFLRCRVKAQVPGIRVMRLVSDLDNRAGIGGRPSPEEPSTMLTETVGDVRRRPPAPAVELLWSDIATDPQRDRRRAQPQRHRRREVEESSPHEPPPLSPPPPLPPPPDRTR